MWANPTVEQQSGTQSGGRGETQRLQPPVLSCGSRSPRPPCGPGTPSSLRTSPEIVPVPCQVSAAHSGQAARAPGQPSLVPPAAHSRASLGAVRRGVGEGQEGPTRAG